MAKTIWVIEDDVALRMILEDALSDVGFTVHTFGQAQLAWQTLQQTTDLPDVILTDIRMPLMNGLDFSQKVRQDFSHIPVIIMTAHADVQSAVDSYQAGAFDYLPKPFELDEAIAVVQKAWQQSRQPKPKAKTANQTALSNHHDDASTPNAHSATITKTPSLDKTSNPSGIIGQSTAMQKVFRAIGRLAEIPMTVLINGESGTGKELIAAALHEHSPRQHKPFIALNMAAIPHDLIEAELFGHEKGAFTGATTTRQGRFEQAHGGTLFLDEIGDMPLPTQTRLLRVLANGEFYRVGGQKPIKVDVRIIAATHQNLEELVKQGKFREDLFYRLNVIRLSLPALRERPEDIPLLANFFMQNIAESLALPPKSISPEAMQRLQHYNWRGNVRQLENACRWLSVMTIGQMVQIDDLPPEILAYYQHQAQPTIDLANPIPTDTTDNANLPVNTHALLTKDRTQPSIETAILSTHDLANPITSATIDSLDWLTPLKKWAETALAEGQQDILQTAVPLFETCLLQVALDHTGQHKGQAAELLGWGRNTVTRKFQQLLDK